MLLWWWWWWWRQKWFKMEWKKWAVGKTFLCRLWLFLFTRERDVLLSFLFLIISLLSFFVLLTFFSLSFVAQPLSSAMLFFLAKFNMSNKNEKYVKRELFDHRYGFFSVALVPLFCWIRFRMQTSTIYWNVEKELLQTYGLDNQTKNFWLTMQVASVCIAAYSQLSKATQYVRNVWLSLDVDVRLHNMKSLMQILT